MANRRFPTVFSPKQDNAASDPKDNGDPIPKFLREPLHSGAPQSATKIPEVTFGSDVAAGPVDDSVPRIGELAGTAVAQATETAAREVENASHAIMQLAGDLDVEAVRYADAIRASGNRMRDAINSLTALSQSTLLAMRAERQKLEALQ